MKLTLRNATVSDVPAMHRVRTSVRENRLSETSHIKEAAYLPYITAGSIWVAETENGILGFSAIDATASRVWALFVDPVVEGAGIGLALHGRMLDWARAEGIAQLTLSTAEGSRAVQFYSRAGWKVASTANGEIRFEKSLLG